MNALFVICGLGVVSLLAEIANLKKWLKTIVVIGLVVASALLIIDWNESHAYYNNMVVFDNYAIAFSVLIFIVSLFWFWISASYFVDQSIVSDRSALVVFAIAGASIMVSFQNLSMLFLGVEILSIPLYVLAGSRKNSMLSNEASFKYFLMGSFATGFLLMGIALVYGATGSFDITVIGEYTLSRAGELPSFFFVGVLLMLIGMTFKMSAVPFHFWAPDVYEGSPTTITAFMSTVVKIAAVGAFFRVFSNCFSIIQPLWGTVLQVIAVLTLVVANVTAVYQTNVKRILAYSSVGHIGYILMALIASHDSASAVLYYYLTAYTFASILAFAILIMLENEGIGTHLDNYNGLFKRNSLLAVSLTIALLSLAGIPPLAGFFGKYLVFAMAIEKDFIGLVVIAILASLISVYYYFKIIIAIYFRSNDSATLEIGGSKKVLLIVLIGLNLIIGIFPDLLLRFF